MGKIWGDSSATDGNAVNPNVTDNNETKNRRNQG